MLRRKLRSLAAAVATVSAFGLAGANASAAVTATASPVYQASLMGVICDGTTDTTTALQQAIETTETTGGTLLLPAGVCVLSKALEITKGLPITLAGAGIDVTTLVQRSGASGILRIRLDHVTVEDMTLDNHLGGGVEIVSSSYNTTREIKALCGSQFMCIFFAGGHGATPLHPTYAQHNKLLDSTVYDTIQNDGISWSYQDHSFIQNLTHTGSRLSLYVDKNTVVDGYTYYPGPQASGLTGWSITTPSFNVTVEKVTTYGAGGEVKADPDDSTSRISRNITISDEVFENPTGYRLAIDDVDGVTISDTDFRGNQLNFGPSVSASNVLVESSTLQAVRFAGAVNHKAGDVNRGTISGLIFEGDTFRAVAGAMALKETFVNFTGGPVSFSVVDGRWENQENGFFRGIQTSCTVTDLRGYTGSSSPCI